MLTLLLSLRDCFRARAFLQAEILALRHQLLALQRSNRGHKLRLGWARSEEHTSELQSRLHLVCRLLLEKKKIRPRSSFHLGRRTVAWLLLVSSQVFPVTFIVVVTFGTRSLALGAVHSRLFAWPRKSHS